MKVLDTLRSVRSRRVPCPGGLAWTLLLGIMVAARASAEPRVSIGGGATLPLSAYATEDNAGFHVAGGLSVPIGAKGVRVRLDGLFSQTPRDHDDRGVTRVVGGALGLSYHVRESGRVSPYFRVGVGLHRAGASACVGAAMFGDGCEPTWMYHETKPSLEGGAGVDVRLERVRLFAEGRMVVVDTKYAVSRYGTTKFVLLTLGVRLDV